MLSPYDILDQGFSGDTDTVFPATSDAKFSFSSLSDADPVFCVQSDDSPIFLPSSDTDLGFLEDPEASSNVLDPLPHLEAVDEIATVMPGTIHEHHESQHSHGSYAALGSPGSWHGLGPHPTGMSRRVLDILEAESLAKYAALSEITPHDVLVAAFERLIDLAGTKEFLPSYSRLQQYLIEIRAAREKRFGLGYFVPYQHICGLSGLAWDSLDPFNVEVNPLDILEMGLAKPTPEDARCLAKTECHPSPCAMVLSRWERSRHTRPAKSDSPRHLRDDSIAKKLVDSTDKMAGRAKTIGDSAIWEMQRIDESEYLDLDLIYKLHPEQHVSHHLPEKHQPQQSSHPHQHQQPHPHQLQHQQLHQQQQQHPQQPQHQHSQHPLYAYSHSHSRQQPYSQSYQLPHSHPFQYTLQRHAGQHQLLQLHQLHQQYPYAGHAQPYP